QIRLVQDHLVGELQPRVARHDDEDAEDERHGELGGELHALPYSTAERTYQRAAAVPRATASISDVRLRAERAPAGPRYPRPGRSSRAYRLFGDDLDATVLGAARRRLVVGDRLGLAEADRRDAARLDALRNHVVTYRLRPPLGQALVVRLAPDRVRVALDRHV